MTAQPEIYPMPSFVGLEVADPSVSSRWYQDALGFIDVFTMPGPGGKPMLVHLRWAKYADVLLSPAASPAAGPRGLGVTLTFNLPFGDIGAVDRLYDRARRAGARIAVEPGNRPWNARDFTVTDPDGYRLTFSAGPVVKDRTFAEVIDQAGREPA